MSILRDEFSEGQGDSWDNFQDDARYVPSDVDREFPDYEDGLDDTILGIDAAVFESWAEGLQVERSREILKALRTIRVAAEDFNEDMRDMSMEEWLDNAAPDDYGDPNDPW